MVVENMEDFEKLLSGCRGALERFVHCKVPSKEDAEDVLQETYMSAYRNRDSLKNREAFRAWIFSIARNKCNDYFAAKARKMEIPIDEISDGDIFYRDTMEHCGSMERFGSIEPYDAMEIYDAVVRNTLEKLKPKDKEILSLYYFKEISQADIAKRLGIPVGTVKSRLHTAKRNFRKNYPLALNVMQNRNGINETKLESRNENVRKDMEKISKMPEFLPEYKIIKSPKAPFKTRWEELMGWFLVPRLNEKICWGMYDWPSRKCTEICRMKVLGEAEVHGIRGVEISVRESDYTEKKGYYGAKFCGTAY